MEPHVSTTDRVAFNLWRNPRFDLPGARHNKRSKETELNHKLWIRICNGSVIKDMTSVSNGNGFQTLEGTIKGALDYLRTLHASASWSRLWSASLTR